MTARLEYDPLEGQLTADIANLKRPNISMISIKRKFTRFVLP